MITNKDLREMFNKLDKITGQNTKNIPVSFNGSLKTTIGRYTFRTFNFNPVKFEFNDQIKKLSYEEVEQIVIHEYAHYLRNSVYFKGSYGHDAEFKKIVRNLGGKETEPKVSSDIMGEINKIKNQEKCHAVCCEKCGKVLRQYKSKCASVTNYTSGRYSCSCGGKLIYKNLNNKSE